MSAELGVLGIVSERLESAGIAFMLTGSFALTYYATPRMTRDLDFVVACEEQGVEKLVSLFSHDFYVDEDAALSAVRLQRLFNLMHLNSGIKVDMIVRKDSEYRIKEFERRQRVQMGSVLTWIASREDLILSKLVWARDTSPEIERMVLEHYRQMTPEERMKIASSMFETARVIVDSSLPRTLTGRDRRLAIARRFYGDELPEAALQAFADWKDPADQAVRPNVERCESLSPPSTSAA